MSRWGLALLAGNSNVKYSETISQPYLVSMCVNREQTVTVKIRRIFLTIFDSSWLVNLAIDCFPAVSSVK